MLKRRIVDVTLKNINKIDISSPHSPMGISNIITTTLSELGDMVPKFSSEIIFTKTNRVSVLVDSQCENLKVVIGVIVSIISDHITDFVRIVFESDINKLTVITDRNTKYRPLDMTTATEWVLGDVGSDLINLLHEINEISLRIEFNKMKIEELKDDIDEDMNELDFLKLEYYNMFGGK